VKFARLEAVPNARPKRTARGPPARFQEFQADATRPAPPLRLTPRLPLVLLVKIPLIATHVTLGKTRVAAAGLCFLAELEANVVKLLLPLLTPRFQVAHVPLEILVLEFSPAKLAKIPRETAVGTLQAALLFTIPSVMFRMQAFCPQIFIRLSTGLVPRVPELHV